MDLHMIKQDTLINPARNRANNLVDTTWFNALWFQSIWFCAVLGQEQLVLVTAALLLLHLALVRDTSRELLQLSALALLGISVDAWLSLTGVFQFPNGVLVPLWLCGLWIAFAAVTGRSLAFLGRRPALASLAGAVAFPLNYWAGARLGAVEFGYPLATTLALMSLVWAIMLPLMFRVTTVMASADDEDRL
jgi:hypothetical protein